MAFDIHKRLVEMQHGFDVVQEARAELERVNADCEANGHEVAIAEEALERSEWIHGSIARDDLDELRRIHEMCSGCAGWPETAAMIREDFLSAADKAEIERFVEVEYGGYNYYVRK